MSNIKTSRKNLSDIVYLLLILLLLPIFFYKLGHSSLVSWDEAWYGVISKNILKTGDYLNLVYNNEPYFDHPPFGFWLQSLSINFFGPSEFAIRFPAAVLGFLTLVAVYSSLSLAEIGEANFDYYYGMIYITSSSAVLSAATLGARIFRQGVLGKAWLLLVLGIVLQSSGDVWYFYLETFEQYYLTHPVDLFWYASYMTIIYALFKHKKII